jgi:hypothetical protein
MKRDTFEREVALPVLYEVPLRLIRSQRNEDPMAASRLSRTTIEEEPIGIVISRGRRDEPAPVVCAYVWGPAPDVDAPETKAA